MKAKLLLIFSLSFYLFSCNGQNSHIPAAVTSAAPVKINRFDKELLKLVETNDSSMQARLVREYPQMLDILGKGILNMKSPAMPGFFDKLANYYSEPTLKGYIPMLSVNMTMFLRSSKLSVTVSHG